MSGGRGVGGDREVSPSFLLRGGGDGRIATAPEATSKEGGAWGKTRSVSSAKRTGGGGLGEPGGSPRPNPWVPHGSEPKARDAHTSVLSTPSTPARPQFSRGISWMITCSASGFASACSTIASVIAATSLRFCSTVRPSQSSTVTTGMSDLLARVLLDLVRGDNHGERSADGDGLPDLDEVLGDHATRRRRQLHRHFLAVDRRERLSLLHGLADSDRPLADRRLLHRQPELRQLHRRGHQATPTPTRDRAACAIRVASGMTNPSSSGAYGIGVFVPQTRTIGARNVSHISSAAMAAISAPKPPRTGASCAINSRPVFSSEVRRPSRSNGTSVRGSMTSSESPSDSSSSAASSASCSVFK